MLIGVVPTERKKLDWKEHVKSLEDYLKLEKTGMMYVLHPDIPSSWKECEEELNKEDGFQPQV